jgi:hypothetical protein
MQISFFHVMMCSYGIFFQSTVAVSTHFIKFLSSNVIVLRAVVVHYITLEYVDLIPYILNKVNTVYNLKYSNHTSSCPPISLMHAHQIASGQLHILRMHM